MTHDLQDLLGAARNRDKALIGLPPGEDDEDANVAWIVGTTAQFKANPVKFDRIIPGVGQIIDVEPTTQTVGVVDDQLVIKIEVPDLPGAADIIDEASDAASLGVLVGNWALSRHFKKIALNRIILEVQKIRLTRATKVAAAFSTSPVRRFKATLKTAKVGRSIVGRSAKQVRLIKKAKSLRFISTRVGAKILFKGIFVVSLAVDVIFISHRVATGFQEEGAEGAVGGLVAGVFDALTFGLAERTADKIEVKTTSATRTFFERIGGLFRGRSGAGTG